MPGCGLLYAHPGRLSNGAWVVWWGRGRPHQGGRPYSRAGHTGEGMGDALTDEGLVG